MGCKKSIAWNVTFSRWEWNGSEIMHSSVIAAWVLLCHKQVLSHSLSSVMLGGCFHCVNEP